MGLAMHNVRVRDKHQITLPMQVVRAAHIRANDTLLVDYRDGVIMLISKTASIPKKKKSIMDFAGITEGLYGKTAEDVHAYISNERASWSR